MLETDEDVVTTLRIIGFLFLFVGVYPSMIFTPLFIINCIIASIVPHVNPFPLLYLLIVFYMFSALGYFFVVKARNLEKQASS